MRFASKLKCSRTSSSLSRTRAYARNRAQKEFEAAVIKRALGIEPEVGIGGIVQRSTKNAPRTLDEANVIASQKFDAVVPSLNTDSRLWDGVNGAVVAGMANPEMTAANRRILKGLTDEWFDLGKLSEIGAEGLKKLDSQIGYTIRKYAGGDPASKTLADELRNVQTVFRQHLKTLMAEASMTKNELVWAEVMNDLDALVADKTHPCSLDVPQVTNVTVEHAYTVGCQLTADL